VLRINPGDRVITRTIDARGFDWENRKVAEPPNPQTGPIFVQGAEPGDVLVVRIEKIEPNRATAWSSTLLAPYAADPEFLRFEGLKQQVDETWNIDKQKNTAWLDSANIRPNRIEVPLKPMLGCVATAPEKNQAIPTSTPDRFGGNMDYNGVVAGVKLMLPVYEPGALLFLGDGHGRQGDGEIVGNALETSMDVEFTVDLIKQKKIRWPRLGNDEYIVVLGSASPLLQALQHATTEMQRWLMADYGCDERGSSLLMGHMLEYDIANIVDPHFTVAAKMRKSYLPGSGR
jgi:acetamidase/formamidase